MIYLPVFARRGGFTRMFEVVYLTVVFGITRYQIEESGCLDPHSREPFQCAADMTQAIYATDLCFLIADVIRYVIWPKLSGGETAVHNLMWIGDLESLTAAMTDVMILMVCITALFVVRLNSEGSEGSPSAEEFEIMNMCNFLILRAQFYFSSLKIFAFLLLIIIIGVAIALWIKHAPTQPDEMKIVRDVFLSLLGFTVAVHVYTK